MPSTSRKGITTFLIIWAGQCVSILGSALTNFGIGVWIYDTTHQATSFALSMLFFSVPGVLLSPVAGALTDRWDRRTAMLISNIGAGISSLFLVLLALSGTVNLWAIYTAMAVNSAFSTLMWPAMTASTSLLVPKEHLGRANGLLQGAEAGSMLVAPVVGALLYVAYGLKALVILDVASFIVAIGTLLAVRIPRPERVSTAREGEKESMLKEIGFGFRYIKERPGLLGLLLFFFGINLIGGIGGVLWTPMLLTLFNKQILGNSESIMGIGALLGTLFMAAWGGPKRRVYGLVGFAGASGLVMLVMGFPPNWVLYAVGGAVFMFGMPIVNACSQAIWQVKVEPGIQGRVFSVRRMIAWCSSPIAALLAGPLADRFFTPGMMPHGRLAPYFGFIGTGPGAGMRLMLIFAGLGVTAIAIVTILNPRVRRVEIELPDAIGESVPVRPTVDEVLIPSGVG